MRKGLGNIYRGYKKGVGMSGKVTQKGFQKILREGIENPII